MNLFLIYTPTYNRAYILPVLWNFLCSQTNKNFVWLIVDDGSSDDTASLVKNGGSPFKIQYVSQKNSGKHVATNKAIEFCNTPLFMVTDSNDKLTERAVDIIYRYYKDDQKM